MYNYYNNESQIKMIKVHKNRRSSRKRKNILIGFSFTSFALFPFSRKNSLDTICQIKRVSILSHLYFFLVSSWMLSISAAHSQITFVSSEQFWGEGGTKICAVVMNTRDDSHKADFQLQRRSYEYSSITNIQTLTWWFILRVKMNLVNVCVHSIWAEIIF